MTLATLGDVRTQIERHLPVHFRDKPPWRHMSAELAKAAAGGDAADVAVTGRVTPNPTMRSNTVAVRRANTRRHR